MSRRRFALCLGAACCISTSSPRTCCWPATASRCCSIFILPHEVDCGAARISIGSAARPAICRPNSSNPFALIARRCDSSCSRRAVGHLFAGRLLYESLTGQVPPASEKRSRELLRSQSRPISRGLEDVLQKCLAPVPNARYADAGELAADLRQHLASLPLRGVANRSLVERWQKWRRRKPQSLNSWLVGLDGTCRDRRRLFVLVRGSSENGTMALKQAELNFADGDFASAPRTIGNRFAGDSLAAGPR